MLFGNLDIARRLENKETASIRNIVKSFSNLYPGSSNDLNLPGGAYACFTGLDQPINRVFNLGMSGPITETEVEQAEDFFATNGMDTEVELCPLADHSVVENLRKRHYYLSRFMNVFYLDLANYKVSPDVKSDITVRPATVAEATEWVQALGAGFAHEGEVIRENQYALMKVVFHRADSTPFLAWVDGEVAGGGIVSIEEGVAGLSTASTLPKFRGRGVQTALLKARLALAVNAGCDLACIHADPGSNSQRNIQRAGFQVAYTNIFLKRSIF